MSDNDRATCTALASLLHAARLLAHWGLTLACLAALALALTPRSLPTLATVGLSAVALLGTLERYFAFRLTFDAALFDGLARNTVTSLEALDQALRNLGLREPRSTQATRPLADRVRGSKQLIQYHVIVISCQSALFLLALTTMAISRSTPT